VRALKREIHALVLACRSPDVSWAARLLALLVVAYALSPIDLIPDIIPVFGLIDDALLLPLGIALAVRMVPPAVLAACRAEAERERPAGSSQYPELSWWGGRGAFRGASTVPAGVAPRRRIAS